MCTNLSNKRHVYEMWLKHLSIYVRGKKVLRLERMRLRSSNNRYALCVGSNLQTTLEEHLKDHPYMRFAPGWGIQVREDARALNCKSVRAN